MERIARRICVEFQQESNSGVREELSTHWRGGPGYGGVTVRPGRERSIFDGFSTSTLTFPSFRHRIKQFRLQAVLRVVALVSTTSCAASNCSIST